MDVKALLNHLSGLKGTTVVVQDNRAPSMTAPESAHDELQYQFEKLASIKVPAHTLGMSGGRLPSKDENEDGLRNEAIKDRMKTIATAK